MSHFNSVPKLQFETRPKGAPYFQADALLGSTKATTATTTRDLAALVELGALRRTGERKHTRYHLNLESESP
jgi:Fic family protein